MVLLLALWTAGSLLFRLHDIALSAQHASAYAAFALAWTEENMKPGRYDPDAVARFFAGPAHAWRTLAGHHMLAQQNLGMHTTHNDTLPTLAQVGGADGQARALRGDWGIEDAGVLTVQSQTRPDASFLLRHLGAAPTIRRHTAILVGAGHADTATVTQRRLAQSWLGWRSPASTSLGLARHLGSRMSAVDAAWKRPLPLYDWLTPWAEEVPDGQYMPDRRRTSGAEHEG